MTNTGARISELPPSGSLRQTEDTPLTAYMPERPENCTCGARLVESARFCHLCGRPVFEPVAAEAAESPQSPSPARQMLPQMTPAGRATPLPVGFGNPVALRVAVIVSLGTLLMDLMQGANPLLVLGGMILWGLAGGWCAVLLYRRLTGYALSVGSGARLGSIAGVLTFLSLMVISALVMTLRGNEVFEQLKKDPQLSQIPNDPATLTIMFLLGVLVSFAIVVGPCAAGGALGARFTSRNNANRV